MEPALGSTVHSQPDGQKILAVDKEDTTRRKTEGVSNCLHAIGNGGARLISDVYTSSIRGLRPALALVLTTRNAQILVAFILGVPFRDAYRSLALSLSRELTDANDILLVSYYPAPLPPWKWTESRMPARCAANRAWCGAVQYALDWQESLDERCGDDFVREGCDDLHRRLRHGDLAAWFLCFVLPLALLLLLLLLLRRALHAFFAFLLRKNRPCAACTCTCGKLFAANAQRVMALMRYSSTRCRKKRQDRSQLHFAADRVKLFSYQTFSTLSWSLVGRTRLAAGR